MSFIKIPYLNESQRHQILRLHRRTEMHDKIRIIFLTQKSLAWQFRPKNESQTCPNNCISCSTAIKGGQCFMKNVVYCITCSLCKAEYVGQTERTIRARICEHTKDSKSHVYIHFATHHNNQHHSHFSWRILASHANASTRLALEALFINKQANLMSGCTGASLLPLLTD